MKKITLTTWQLKKIEFTARQQIEKEDRNPIKAIEDYHTYNKTIEEDRAYNKSTEEDQLQLTPAADFENDVLYGSWGS